MSFRSVQYQHKTCGSAHKHRVDIDDPRFKGWGIFVTIGEAKKMRDQLDREINKAVKNKEK